jgi:DNA-binding CsgD family transcriptional regulator
MKLEQDLMQKGAEAEKQGAILLQSDGMILCISLFAKEMLKKYFDVYIVEGNPLPERLLAWFTTETTPLSPPLRKNASKGFPKRVERLPLTVEKGNNCLKIKLLNDVAAGDHVLVITEMDPSLSLQNLREYGLSCRETEVLIWLSKGKTNVEIAIILGMSKRTAEKHMENILAKLGVETRAAAVAIMREV